MSNFAGFLGTNSRKNRPNFAGVFGANFTEKQSGKNGRFCGYFQGKFRKKSIGFAPGGGGGYSREFWIGVFREGS